MFLCNTLNFKFTQDILKIICIALLTALLYMSFSILTVVRTIGLFFILNTTESRFDSVFLVTHTENIG